MQPEYQSSTEYAPQAHFHDENQRHGYGNSEHAGSQAYEPSRPLVQGQENGYAERGEYGS